jgi:hypothetical protein
MFLNKIATYLVINSDANYVSHSFDELQKIFEQKSIHQKKRLRAKVMKEIFPVVWYLRSRREKVKWNHND